MSVLLDFTDELLLKKPVCMAIGNFDGVHYAHQALIKKLVARAEEEGCSSVVLTFDPHPALLYKNSEFPDKEFFLLQTKAEKVATISELGVDFIVFINFTPEFSRISAADFVRTLSERINIKILLVGYNFRFGWQREANSVDLQNMLSRKDVRVEVFPSFQAGERRLCSSALRQALACGNVELFHEFTGRFFTLSGLVVHGDGRGGKIGFPTANLQIRENGLGGGVYAVKACCSSGIFPALANFGSCPTFRSFSERRLEVHIPGLNIDLYGQEITVHFMRKIRDERKFSDSGALCEAIKKDLHRLEEFACNW